LNFINQERNMPRKAVVKPSSANAIEILTEDHRNIVQMFKDFESLKRNSDDDEDAKQALVERACMELTIHSQLEEEFFYPAIRASMSRSDLLDEAEVEHAIANQLVTELESMEPGDDLYDAKFKVLGEYVRHHIEEEQEKLFPLARKADLDFETLGEGIRRRQEELRAEFGLPEEDEKLHEITLDRNASPQARNVRI
jgi:hemerythrin-like domain-containing protein